MEAPLSPNAMFAMRDNKFKEESSKSFFKSVADYGGDNLSGGQLSPRSEKAVAYCICGLPMRVEQENCDQCEGKNQIYMEGTIIKKQKKEGKYRKYCYVLLGKELYSYKNSGD